MNRIDDIAPSDCSQDDAGRWSCFFKNSAKDCESGDIMRWDSVEEAFTFKPAYKVASFKADKDTFVYKDAKTFWNNGTTYYRCVAE